MSFCWSYLVEAGNKNLEIGSWLTAYIKTDSGSYIEISNSQEYISKMKKNVVGSILSPKEIWGTTQRNFQIKSDKRYLYLFHQWYLTDLPIIIFYKKTKKEGVSDVIKVVENIEGVRFLFDTNVSFTSEEMIKLAEKYNYTYFEKLNLFLFALHRNITEEELLKLFKTWGIDKKMAVDIKDYAIYIDYFFEKFSSNKKNETKYFRKLLKKQTQSLTSVLHELVYSQRRDLFAKIIEDDKIDVNIQDYLLQTALHKIAQIEYSKSAFFLYTLLNHPRVYINIPDFQNRTAIFYAVLNSQNDYFSSVEKFLDQSGILLDVVDSQRKTLTLLAAERGMPFLAQVLHEHGASLPNKVSIENSFLLSNYQAVWFIHKRYLSLEKLVDIFNLDKEGISFNEFQTIIDENRTMDIKAWNSLRYYFLFHFLQTLLYNEEQKLSTDIISLLFNNKNSTENYSKSQALKAIYEGDMVTFFKVFSKQKSKMEWLESSLFNTKYLFPQNSSSEKVVSDFDIIKRYNINSIDYLDKNIWAFDNDTGSFLSEAIRSAQVEMVLFLLQQGVDPTIDKPGFILKDNIMLVILMNGLIYKNRDVYKDYLRIVELVVSHPSVTKKFLEREVIPGINYVDLAVIEGNLPILKLMYKKGARNSRTVLWNTNVSVEMVALSSNFFKTSEFLIEKKVEDKPNSESLKKQLNLCRRAFH